MYMYNIPTLTLCFCFLDDIKFSDPRGTARRHSAIERCGKVVSGARSGTALKFVPRAYHVTNATRFGGQRRDGQRC